MISIKPSDFIRHLFGGNAGLKRENEDMRKTIGTFHAALEYYADPGRYIVGMRSYGMQPAEILLDQGMRARTALGKWK